MKDHPIIFSGESVRAILAGKKTQTRRVIRNVSGCNLRCSPFQVGQILWVRETWGETVDAKGSCLVRYRADGTAYHMLCDNGGEDDPVDHGWKHYEPGIPDSDQRWRSSIHMPRWASRITLEVTDVRVQRAQDIDEKDALAEGYEFREHFIRAWDSLNAKRGFGFDENPWLWAITFKRLEPLARAREGKA
jgi:ribosomal protein S28E/S33